MVGPNLNNTGITPRTGLQTIEDDYIRLEDVLTHRIWTNNLKVVEVDADTLGLYDKASGAILKYLKTGNKRQESFPKILAALATHVAAGASLAGATPLAIPVTLQPDVPRNLTWEFVSHVNITAYTIVITGVNSKGKVVTTTLYSGGGGPWTGVTREAYAIITSIIMTTRTGTGVGDTINIGIGSRLGLANHISTEAELYKVTKSVTAGNSVDYSGAGNVTVDTDYDVVDVSTGVAIADGDTYSFWY